jgi:hypothetical protein
MSDLVGYAHEYSNDGSLTKIYIIWNNLTWTYLSKEHVYL